MASLYNPDSWYWATVDTNFGTHVYFTGSTNGYVLVSDAAYLAWLAADGGNSPTIIDTFANLMQVINEVATSRYRGGYASFNNPGGTINLTNPMPNIIEITGLAANRDLILPPANTVNSIPKFTPFEIRQLSGIGFTLTVKRNDGAIQTALTTLSAMRNAILHDNSTPGGVYSHLRLGTLAATESASDLQTGTVQAARMPGLTGDVTSSAGSVNTTIKSNVALAGNPTTTTQAGGTNNTTIATTAFVQSEKNSLGAATATTPAIGDNDTSVATTAFVHDRPAFRAHKNGTDQSGITSGATTKITFGTEDYDIGSYYDTSNSRWTPPAGRVSMSATVYTTANIVDQVAHALVIEKNGGFFAIYDVNASGTGAFSLSVTVDDVANGSDFYEVFYIGNGAGNKTIEGDSFQTWFCGHSI